MLKCCRKSANSCCCSKRRKWEENKRALKMKYILASASQQLDGLMANKTEKKINQKARHLNQPTSMQPTANHQNKQMNRTKVKRCHAFSYRCFIPIKKSKNNENTTALLVPLATSSRSNRIPLLSLFIYNLPQYKPHFQWLLVNP